MNSPAFSVLADPSFDAIWSAAAGRVGFRVARTEAAYASTDGQGTLMIGVDDCLDADDSVAQLIFHELCHAAVQGPSAWRSPDWGLSNEDGRDIWREHACLRVQACLAAAAGLRSAMRPTTDYKLYYGALLADPLAPFSGSLTPRNELDPGGLGVVGATDAAVVARARETLAWFSESSWREPIEQALIATAALLKTRVPAALDGGGENVHPLGFPLEGEGEETCGSCAWGTRLAGSMLLGCRQVLGLPQQPKKIAAETPACARWESTLNCQECGACCREAYHSVSVSVRDPVVWKQPQLLVRQGPRFQILREGDRCAALRPGSGEEPRWTCVIYDDRPRTCRDFTAGTRHCLEARRRVGLSVR